MTKYSKVTNFLLLIGLTLSLSCQKESITPIAPAQTIVEQRNDAPIKMSYPIVNMGVDRIGGTIRRVPLIGGILRKFTEVFADITIKAKGTVVDIEPTHFSFPELDDVDFDIIKFINLDNVVLKINDVKEKKKNIDFIKKMKIHLTVFDDIEGEMKVRILEFDRETSTDNCNGKCIRMEVVKSNWKEILSQYRDFIISVELIIDKVPKSEMTIDGLIDFSLAIDLGF